MRKYVLAAIMAATALVPAAAFAQDRGNWQGRGGDGGGDRGSHQRGGEQRAQQAQPQQAQPQARSEVRVQQQFQPQPRATPQGGGFRADGEARSTFQRGNFGVGARADAQAPAQVQAQPGWQGNRGADRTDWQQRRDQAQRDQGQRDQAAQGANGNRGDVQRERPDWQDRARRDRAAQGWNGNRGDQQDWRRDQRGNGSVRNDRGWQERNNGDRRYADNGNRGYDNRGGNWNRSWRSDNRYNYNWYRNSNRNVFHLPRYYAPYGWDYGYRRFSIGFSLSEILYSQDYWIDDAEYYRLPPAYGPYRWVRYYNDALLVDIDTGEVVDTVYDIFW